MCFGAPLGKGASVAQSEVRVRKRQTGQGGRDGFGKGIVSGAEFDGHAGLAHDVEIAIEAANVDSESLGKRSAVVGGFAENLDEAIKADETLRGDCRTLGRRPAPGPRSTLFAHRILTVKTTPPGVRSRERLFGWKTDRWDWPGAVPDSRLVPGNGASSQMVWTQRFKCKFCPEGGDLVNWQRRVGTDGMG